ncbi:MAG: hypothetical protein GX657_08680 [Chloroflexi bacterium]|nr:hypothetical protein [Chloroflexota bacterium]
MGAIVGPERVALGGGWLAAARRALPLADVVLALAVAAVWYLPEEGPWGGALATLPWSAGLLAGLWLLQWRRTLRAWWRSPMALPLGLFLISAGVSVWAAYDPALAWLKAWRILTAVGLCWAIAHQPDPARLYVVLAGLGLAAAGIAVAFLAGGLSGLLLGAGGPAGGVARAVGRLLGGLPSFGMNANSAGGLAALFLPLYVPLLTTLRPSGGPRAGGGRAVWPLTVLWTACAGLAGLTVLISRSRGAWVALAAVGVLWALWRTGRRRGAGAPDAAIGRRTTVLALGALPLLVVGAVALMALASGVADLPGVEGLRNRASLMATAAVLARDCFFTGAGLGTFPMQFSVYALLIHVGYVPHAHNLFLDVLIEQGVLGLLGLAWLVGAALAMALRQLRRGSGPTSWVVEAAVASLLVGLAHGLVDDVLYESRAMLFLWVPFGLLLATSSWQRGEVDEKRRGPARWCVPAGLAAAAVTILLCWPTARAAFYANLGAVAQARAELGVYDQEQFEEHTVDAVRQEVDLGPATALFERALAADPRQATARERLAAVALSRGAYGEALAHMEAAWAGGQRGSVTRLLLGDALVATGDPTRAAEVVRGEPWGVPRLLWQLWKRYYAYGDWQRALDAGTAVLLLDPGSEDAALGVRLARQRLGGP